MKRILTPLLALMPGMVLAQDMGTAARQLFERHNFIGMSVATQHGQDAPDIWRFGETAKRSGVEIPQNASWHVGSISKSFTAVLMLMQVEKGFYTLDTPLAELLPQEAESMHPDWHGLTMRQVLTHRAGISANPNADQMRASAEGALDVSTFLKDVWNAPREHAAGTFLYSNVGYILAGYVVERFGEETWETLIRTQIAKPLGLKHLGLGAPNIIQGHAGFLRHPMPTSEIGSDNPPILSAAGRLHMSMTDLLLWGRFLLDACAGKSNILGQSMCQEMRPKEQDFGFGIARFALPNVVGEVIGHDGSNSMWFAFLALHPKQDRVMVFAVNDGRMKPAIKTAVELAQISFKE